MSKHVVICGGGVIGCATAYFLAATGTKVTVIESDGIASGASGAAAGILSRPSTDNTDDPLFEIRMAGFNLHQELAQTLPSESGVQYDYSVTPRVIVPNNETEVSELLNRLSSVELAESSAELLDANALAKQTGWIDKTRYGGAFLDAGAQVDPYKFTLALVAAAERSGVKFITGKVMGIKLNNQSFQSVTVDHKTISGDACLLSMGPWAKDASPWVNRPIPVRPLKGQIIKTRPQKKLTHLTLLNGSNYAITRENGLLILGTTEEDVGFDTSITDTARDEIITFGLTFSSALETAELIEQTACLRPLSDDGRPIMGELIPDSNLFISTGHGRQGILMSPAAGRAMSDLINTGETGLLDLSPFNPERFN
jgi:glycine oxidase